jgi:hypothetical protein
MDRSALAKGLGDDCKDCGYEDLIRIAKDGRGRRKKVAETARGPVVGARLQGRAHAHSKSAGCVF